MKRNGLLSAHVPAQMQTWLHARQPGGWICPVLHPITHPAHSSNIWHLTRCRNAEYQAFLSKVSMVNWILSHASRGSGRTSSRNWGWMGRALVLKLSEGTKMGVRHPWREGNTSGLHWSSGPCIHQGREPLFLLLIAQTGPVWLLATLWCKKQEQAMGTGFN